MINKLDMTLVPGTPQDQKWEAEAWLRRRKRPIRIAKVGRKWEIFVLGTSIGFVSSKTNARSAAHQVGRYRLDLGDFARAYVTGW